VIPDRADNTRTTEQMRAMIMRRKKLNGNGGFTLVELVVVMVILSIVASIGIPAFTGYIDKGKARECESNRRALAARYVSEQLADASLTMVSCISASSDLSCPLASSGEQYSVVNKDGRTYLHCSHHTDDVEYSAGNVSDWEVSAVSYDNENQTPNGGTGTGSGTQTPGDGTDTDNGTDDGGSTPEIKVSISVSPKTNTLELGASTKLTANLTVEGLNETPAISWTSSNSSVATVDQNGNVTAAGIGTCQIIASVTVNGEIKSDSATVTVINSGNSNSNNEYGIQASGSQNSYLLRQWDQAGVTVAVTDKNGNVDYSQEVEWKVVGDDIIYVYNDGNTRQRRIVSKGITGSCTLIAYLKNDPSTSVSFTVSTWVEISNFSITLEEQYKNNWQFNMTVGQQGIVMPVFSNESNPTYGDVEYTSSDNSIMSVVKNADGTATVTAHKKGTVTITGKTQTDCKGNSWEKSITIYVSPIQIQLTADKETIYCGETVQLEVSGLTEGVSLPEEFEYTVTSWDTSVATVNNKGEVTALKSGSVTIQCTSKTPDITDSAKITLEIQPLQIELSVSPTMKVGETQTIIPIFKAGDTETTYKPNVRFYTYYDWAASLTQDGILTAKNEGSIEVRCVSETWGVASETTIKITVTN
jgi:prepilin-type N-terminal cleavage/methylation domain-containing protein